MEMVLSEDAMITAIEGIYHDGKIEIHDFPQGIHHARVLVTFLQDESESISSSKGSIVHGIERLQSIGSAIPTSVSLVDELIEERRSDGARD